MKVRKKLICEEYSTSNEPTKNNYKDNQPWLDRSKQLLLQSLAQLGMMQPQLADMLVIFILA